MASEARADFHRAMERLDIAVGSLLGLIPEAVQTATASLLGPDPGREIAAGVERWRRSVEELYGDVEHTIEVVVARQAPVAGDLRFLLACLRLVPTLHEAVDLAVDAAGASASAGAGPASDPAPPDLPAAVAQLAGSLGEETAAVWSAVGALWSTRDPAVLDEVPAGAGRVAAAHSALVEQLDAGALELTAALELVVAAQAYERLGRRALHAARLIAPLAVAAP